MRILLPVERKALEILKAKNTGLVEKKIWVSGTNGRKGHWRMQWILPGRGGVAGNAKQMELFSDDDYTENKKPVKQKKNLDMIPRSRQVDLSEAESIGKINITAIGQENVYFKKDGLEYFFKPGRTDDYQVGEHEFKAKDKTPDDGIKKDPLTGKVDQTYYSGAAGRLSIGLRRGTVDGQTTLDAARYLSLFQGQAAPDLKEKIQSAIKMLREWKNAPKPIIDLNNKQADEAEKLIGGGLSGDDNKANGKQEGKAKTSPVSFGAYQNNVLDLVGKKYKTAKGESVVIERPAMDFIVKVDGKEKFRSSDNLSTAGFMNKLEVYPDDGKKSEPKPETKSSRFNPERHLKAYADSWQKLRKDDVYRVLEESKSVKGGDIDEMANAIKVKRPDLAQEVDESMEDMGIHIQMKPNPDRLKKSIQKPIDRLKARGLMK